MAFPPLGVLMEPPEREEATGVPEINVQDFPGRPVVFLFAPELHGLSVVTTQAPLVSVIFSLCLNVLWADVTGPL